MDWLQKMRLGRVPAVALVMIVTVAATGGVAWVIFDQLVGVANELPRYQQNIHNKLEAMRAPGEGALGQATKSIKELATELMSVEAPAPPVPGDRGSRPQPVQIVDQPANELEYLRDLAQPFLGPLGEFGMVLIFSVFLLINQKDLRNRLFRLVGLDQLNVMTQALDDATQRVSRYLLMQLLVNVGFGVLCGIGLYLIGIPYAALWGSVAGILRIVPYVGAVVSGLLPFTLALAVFDNWMHPAAGIAVVRRAGTGDQQLRGTVALWNPHGNLRLGAASDRGILDGSVGTRGPDSVDSAHGLRGGPGPLRAGVFISACPAGR